MFEHASQEKATGQPNAARALDELAALPTLPHVSIVMPILNEAAYIEECLAAIFRQTYPSELMEIIVADGFSNDGTREILQRYIDGYRPNADDGAAAIQIQLIDNPRRIVSTALNAAIQRASGEIIVRIDGHTIIEPDYVYQCILALHRTQADGVGGPMVAEGRGYLAEAIAMATSTPFGIGNSTYRTSNYFKERPVETTHMGAYRKQKLLDVGLFNEKFVRHQDYELDYRIRQSGGTIFLSPAIKSHYFVRGRLRKLWRQYSQYGFWKGRFLRRQPTSLRVRHMVPPLFVLALAMSVGLAALGVEIGRIALFGTLALYVLFLVAATVTVCRWRAKWRFAPLFPTIIACIHVSWGAGVWIGLLLPEALSPRQWER